MANKKSFDSLVLGIIVGALLPVTVFLIVYFVKYHDSAMYSNLNFKSLLGTVVPKVMSLCAIANLAPFYFFLQTNRMLSVRGVLVGTVVVALLVFLVFLLF